MHRFGRSTKWFHWSAHGHTWKYSGFSQSSLFIFEGKCFQLLHFTHRFTPLCSSSLLLGIDAKLQLHFSPLESHHASLPGLGILWYCNQEGAEEEQHEHNCCVIYNFQHHLYCLILLENPRWILIKVQERRKINREGNNITSGSASSTTAWSSSSFSSAESASKGSEPCMIASSSSSVMEPP